MKQITESSSLCSNVLLLLEVQDNEQLTTTLQEIVARGAKPRGVIRNRELAEELVNQAANNHATQLETNGAHNPPKETAISSLSEREREIFLYLAEGMQNASIARKLFISPRTVETHRARIVRKLGLKTNGDIIRFAIRNGLSIL